jgi:DNA-binding LytR/AlgR family response regulator
MNCIIIEDEPLAADHLAYLLNTEHPEFFIKTQLDSVKNAVTWLQYNTTDLIFLDVHLSDGLSFGIFEQLHITTPIIFCTAYDEFAVKAFSVNSISYLLKPIDSDELKKAILKFKELYSSPQKMIPEYTNLIGTERRYQQRFLINMGNSLLSITSDEIAFVFTSNKTVIIVTMDGRQHLFDATLDQMERKLNPDSFFRINRQYIISVNAISRMENFTRGRVIIQTTPSAKEELVVSIDRANEFKNWLNR